MKTILENLTNTNGEVTTKVLNVNNSLNPYVQLAITKGNLTQNMNVWGSVQETRMKGFYAIDVDDWEAEGAFLGNIKVDSLTQLHEALTKAGLKTLADSLEISKEEVHNAFIKVVRESKEVKLLFKGLECYNLLPTKQKVAEKLKIVKVENIRNMYLPEGKELIADLIALEVVTQEDIDAKIKELSE